MYLYAVQYFNDYLFSCKTRMDLLHWHLSHKLFQKQRWPRTRAITIITNNSCFAFSFFPFFLFSSSPSSFIHIANSLLHKPLCCDTNQLMRLNHPGFETLSLRHSHDRVFVSSLIDWTRTDGARTGEREREKERERRCSVLIQLD